MSKTFIIGGGPLFDGVDRFYQNGALKIEGDRIVYVGELSAIQTPGVVFHDVRGRLILPGLINLHHHFYSAFARGISPVGPTPDFLHNLKNLWWRLDKALDLETVRLSARLSLVNCVRHGVTTVFDHHSSPNAVSGSLNEIASAVKMAGINATLCYEVSDRDGCHICAEAIEENLEFMRTHKPDKKVRGVFGLHANFTLSENTLKTAASRLPSGAGIHIHCGEDFADAKYCRELGFDGPVDRLVNYGLLNPFSILAHGIHLTEREINQINASKAALVHNPESNCMNAVGELHLNKFSERLPGLGTDGMTSSMLHTLRAGFLLQRQVSKNPESGFDLLPVMLFRRNAEIAAHHFKDTLGVLKTGARADVAVFDYKPFTPINLNNIFGHLIFGVYNATAEVVYSSGIPLLKAGKLLTLDETEIDEQAREQAPLVWKKYYGVIK